MARYTEKPKDINKVLAHSSLANQQQQVKLMQQLNTVLAQVLQLEQLSFCRVTSIRDGRAIILCSSPSWLTRLKMQRDAILDNFRKKILPDLAGIEIEASPTGQTRQFKVEIAQPVAMQHNLSAQAADALLSVAAGADGKLKQALLNLAKNRAK
ncbi:DciA family protein [Rheinheimera salexigens]|uniref:RNA-binding protein n=1 Tax=Rheinheimera salexigens TaxID=1628148 RepID=A0A1E7Q404_9GAMM|nr:DciA family protein [Rheinheimera salexigens]OEY68905.1 hypothetical protein BI198_04480 [Rheinheimera salexigens]